MRNLGGGRPRLEGGVQHLLMTGATEYESDLQLLAGDTGAGQCEEGDLPFLHPGVSGHYGHSRGIVVQDHTRGRSRDAADDAGWEFTIAGAVRGRFEVRQGYGDIEGLVDLVDLVARDGHGEGRTSGVGWDGGSAGGGGVVLSGDGRAVGGCPFHLNRRVDRSGKGNSEGHGGGSRVALSGPCRGDGDAWLVVVVDNDDGGPVGASSLRRVAQPGPNDSVLARGVQVSAGGVGQQLYGHRAVVAERRVVHSLQFDHRACRVPAEDNLGGQRCGYVMPVLRGSQ